MGKIKMKKAYGNGVLETVYEFFKKNGQVVKLANANAWIVNYPGDWYESPTQIYSTYEEAVIIEINKKKWLISLGYTNGYRYVGELFDILAIRFSDGDDPVKLIRQNYEHSHSLVFVGQSDSGEIASEIKEIKRFLEDELFKYVVSPRCCHSQKKEDGGEVFCIDSTKYDKESLSNSLFNFFMSYLKNKKP